MKSNHCLLTPVMCLAASTAFAIETTPLQPAAANCAGTLLPNVGGKAGGKQIQAWKLADGGIAAWSGMNINIDGYARAYHPRNRDAGAVLHLCVGGKVWLPDGSSYEGSESGATCRGKFMTDVTRIETAGWTDVSVGVVQWYGIAAEDSATIAGHTVNGIKPVLQKDGSGFYVSPTSLVDKSITDRADQNRYVNPLRVAAAVVPGNVVRQGVPFGSFGVTIDAGRKIAVPFVVGDGGPRIGEGSPALARQVAGLKPSDNIDIKNRYAGQADGSNVLWVFFGGPTMAFDHTKEADVAVQAKAAFERWGGEARLAQCVAAVQKP
jgi:hypothetical protein